MAFFSDEGRGGGGGGGNRGGEWICSTCGNSVYGFRKECNRCGTSKYAGKVVCDLLAYDLCTFDVRVSWRDDFTLSNCRFDHYSLFLQFVPCDGDGCLEKGCDNSRVYVTGIASDVRPFRQHLENA